MQKAIVVICDGMPDRPLQALYNQTPLEVASTPNLDKIAIDGISGMMHPVGIGVRPGSDTAHLSLFGYDPYSNYSGRGPYECAGIGMAVQKGDLALRVNAGTIDKNWQVLDRRAGRIESTKEVVDFLGPINIEGVDFIMKSSLGHRIGLVLKGKNLNPRVSDQDPHAINTKLLTVKPLDDSSSARFTARILNEFSQLAAKRLWQAAFNERRQVQGLLPANALLFRGAGSIPENLLSFKQKYNLDAAFIAAGPMYKGIAKILGMEIIEFGSADGVTGMPDSNIGAKINRALKLIDKFDIVFVHIKAADSLAEDGDFEGKIKFIEKIDQACKPLTGQHNFLTVITSDHTTSSFLKMHTADPVPITIKGRGVRTDDIYAFNESECAQGRLHSINGQNLMPIVIDLMGIAQLFGA